jgi:hypothetical protein
MSKERVVYTDMLQLPPTLRISEAQDLSEVDKLLAELDALKEVRRG